MPSLHSVRLPLNRIWVVLGGLWLAVGCAFVALARCILLITIRFGSLPGARCEIWPEGTDPTSLPG